MLKLTRFFNSSAIRRMPSQEAMNRIKDFSKMGAVVGGFAGGARFVNDVCNYGPVFPISTNAKTMPGELAHLAEQGAVVLGEGVAKVALGACAGAGLGFFLANPHITLPIAYVGCKAYDYANK